LEMSRAVAITLSPRARTVRTKTSPKPEEVPVMNQVWVAIVVCAFLWCWDGCRCMKWLWGEIYPYGAVWGKVEREKNEPYT